MITIEQALEAIDNLDDYARMDAGVDAVGPREALTVFVGQCDQLRAENERLNKQINSYKLLVKSLEETKTYLLKKAEQNKEAVETLASEREVNAVLTGEIERLKAELAEAKKDVEILHWLFGYTPAMLYVLFDANDEKELRAAIYDTMKETG